MHSRGLVLLYVAIFILVQVQMTSFLVDGSKMILIWTKQFYIHTHKKEILYHKKEKKNVCIRNQPLETLTNLEFKIPCVMNPN